MAATDRESAIEESELLAGVEGAIERLRVRLRALRQVREGVRTYLTTRESADGAGDGHLSALAALLSAQVPAAAPKPTTAAGLASRQPELRGKRSMRQHEAIHLILSQADTAMRATAILRELQSDRLAYRGVPSVQSVCATLKRYRDKYGWVQDEDRGWTVVVSASTQSATRECLGIVADGSRSSTLHPVS